MKKIGIFTYFNYYNYGSMLQGYATQQAFNKVIGQNNLCELVDYHYISSLEKSRRKRLLYRILNLYKYLFRFKELRVKRRFKEKMNLRNDKFDNFKRNYTKVSTTKYHDKADFIKNKPEYDIYVVGSDQTWSPKVSGGYSETPMLLDFIPSSKIKCAYAPSLGVTELSCRETELLRKNLKEYHIISCREAKGAQILSKILDTTIPHVLDPTLLLSPSEWKSIAVRPNIGSNKYILCYFLGDREYYRKFAQQLSEQLGLPLYYIPVSWKDCNESNNLIFEAGPQEFIGLIDNAHTVLTDSFHGVAFCTNLNKDFYCFTKHSGGVSSGDNSRIYDFLNNLGLSDRLILTYEEDDIDYKPIDFTEVNDKIAEHRQVSMKVVKDIVELIND